MFHCSVSGSTRLAIFDIIRLEDQENVLESQGAQPTEVSRILRIERMAVSLL